MIAIGDWLRRRREKLGLSLSKIHLKTGGAVGISNLSKIEGGHREPSPEVLRALAPIYGTSVEELYKLAGYLPQGDNPREAEELDWRAIFLADKRWPMHVKKVVIELLERYVRG